jgi:predicted ATPase/DNA-binding SARP family transcriptional activator
VEKEGDSVGLGGPKPRLLLAALLAHEGRSVSTDGLIDTLWGDHPPVTATKTLQKYVSLLRKELGNTLVTRRDGYAIDVASDQVDARRFEVLLTSAESALPVERIELLEEALALWRGEPFPELADSTVGTTEATRLSELRMSAIEDLIEARLEVRDHDAIVGRLEALTAEHPFRERLWGQLMLALYRSGRQSEALNTYQRLRSILGEELGIEPSTELSQLEERILLHDPSLAPADTDATQHNLPSALTTFVGRAVEMDEIGDLLSKGRLVTVLGPAGSGKTRLAVELARSLLSDYTEGGVWFVDLAPVSSPDQVADAIAKSLGVGQLANRPTDEVLAGYLARRRLLLILDNCEHLVARVATVADRLLRVSPDLVVLATSRERLGVTGEIIYDLAPLPYPGESEMVTEEFDGVRLFLERARAVSRDDELDSNRAAVGEVVRRLDGIPLALELAAARVRTLGLSELRDRLDDRFAVLISPSHAGLDRHVTLRAAVDWSYQLLDDAEQTLFRRLSVFRGGFTLAAVGEVCDFDSVRPSSIAGLVGELVDKSLVSVGASRAGSRRYYLLETLREFGHMVLDSSEVGTLRDAHADYFCKFAEHAANHLQGPEQTLWLEALRADHDNLRKALRWAATTSPETAVRLAIAMSRFWDSVGPRAEGHEWLRRAVELARPLDPRLRIEALVQASDLFSSVHASLPRSYAEEAVAAAKATGDVVGEARALRALAWALALDEKPKASRDAGLEALAIFEHHDDPWELALCLERVGQSGYQDPEWSIGILKRALELYREVGDRTREALVLYKIADRLSNSLGNTTEARRHVEQAIAICDEVGSVHDGAHAKLEYGKILRRCGEYEQAVRVLDEALDELTKSGDERCSVRTLTALGTTLVDAGKREAAEETLAAALDRGRDVSEKHTSRVAMAGLARLMAESGRDMDAVVLLGFVAELSRRLAIPVTEMSRQKREAHLRELRERVGDEEFDRLWEKGRGLEMDEAIGIAVGSRVG